MKISFDGENILHSARDSYEELEPEEIAVELVFVLAPPRGLKSGMGLLVEIQYSLEDDEADFVLNGSSMEQTQVGATL